MQPRPGISERCSSFDSFITAYTLGFDPASFSFLIAPNTMAVVVLNSLPEPVAWNRVRVRVRVRASQI